MWSSLPPQSPGLSPTLLDLQQQLSLPGMQTQPGCQGTTSTAETMPTSADVVSLIRRFLKRKYFKEYFPCRTRGEAAGPAGRPWTTDEPCAWGKPVPETWPERVFRGAS